jgi:hypothetical protein
LEILFGNLSYILARLQQRFQELFLPSRALSPGRQVAIEVCSAQGLLTHHLQHILYTLRHTILDSLGGVGTLSK